MSDNAIVFSVITPVYGCSTSLYELYLRLVSTLQSIASSFEIIFVNDYSPDNAWHVITDISRKDRRVKGINLSRNFGQHYAIYAGLTYAKGKWIIIMDCDLQDQPEEISKLYYKALEGFDVVYGCRKNRRDGFLKVFLSKLFYKLFGYLTDTKQDSRIANFGIYNSKVIEAVLSMGDCLRYFPTMVRWVGFNQTIIDIEHAERTDGKSSYSFKKLLRLSLDVILAFSEKPLRLTVKLGLSISFLALCSIIVFLVLYFSGIIQVIGYTSLIISIWLLSGIIIFVIGIVGLYVGKTFENVKKRPAFIVRDKLNIEDN
ncbi:MAG: glycosyltransferase family 2 protein [Bacteroidales bacterium]|nr:glycosyltransferase family 2 protein [Bacteroidales bacterium]